MFNFTHTTATTYEKAGINTAFSYRSWRAGIAHSEGRACPAAPDRSAGYLISSPGGGFTPLPDIDRRFIMQIERI